MLVVDPPNEDVCVAKMPKHGDCQGSRSSFLDWLFFEISLLLAMSTTLSMDGREDDGRRMRRKRRRTKRSRWRRWGYLKIECCRRVKSWLESQLSQHLTLLSQHSKPTSVRKPKMHHRHCSLHCQQQRN